MNKSVELVTSFLDNADISNREKVIKGGILDYELPLSSIAFNSLSIRARQRLESSQVRTDRVRSTEEIELSESLAA